MELFILLSAGVPATSAHLLSNHYNQTRSEYYRLLAESTQRPSEQGVFAFLEYALQGYVDSLKEQIEEIKVQQLLVHQQDPVPVAQIRQLTPELATAYARKRPRPFNGTSTSS